MVDEYRKIKSLTFLIYKYMPIFLTTTIRYFLVTNKRSVRIPHENLFLNSIPGKIMDPPCLAR